MIQIIEAFSIPEEEVSFTASRSSGPGGQNVNKVNTRVTVWFDVQSSPSLSERQKRLIGRRLANRINRNGVLRVARQRHRSQSANRKEAVEHLIDLLSEALQERKPRKKTKISKAAKERCHKEKVRHSELKRQRSKAAITDHTD